MTLRWRKHPARYLIPFPPNVSSMQSTMSWTGRVWRSNGEDYEAQDGTQWTANRDVLQGTNTSTGSGHPGRSRIHKDSDEGKNAPTASSDAAAYGGATSLRPTHQAALSTTSTSVIWDKDTGKRVSRNAEAKDIVVLLRSHESTSMNMSARLETPPASRIGLRQRRDFLYPCRRLST